MYHALQLLRRVVKIALFIARNSHPRPYLPALFLAIALQLRRRRKLLRAHAFIDHAVEPKMLDAVPSLPQHFSFKRYGENIVGRLGFNALFVRVEPGKQPLLALAFGCVFNAINQARIKFFGGAGA